MAKISFLKDWLRGLGFNPSTAAGAPPGAGVERVRRLCLAALEDCHTADGFRVRGQLCRASGIEELWFLRTEIYQVVTRVHCQFEAARRLNALMPSFESVLPQRLLCEW